MDARVKLSEHLKGLTRTELERAIYESALSRESETMARRYLIEKIPQADIAEEFHYCRSSVSAHLSKIIKAIDRTARKL